MKKELQDKLFQKWIRTLCVSCRKQYNEIYAKEWKIMDSSEETRKGRQTKKVCYDDEPVDDYNVTAYGEQK